MRKLLLIAAMVLLCAGAAQAEILIKIALVDTQRVMEQCQLGKEIKQQLEKLLVDEQQKVDVREQELERLKKDLDDGLLLSDAKKSAKEEELRQKYKEYQIYAREAKSRLDESQKKALKPVIKEINTIIKKISVEEGYSLVLDKNYAGILYSSSDVNLTDRVIRLMDEKRQ